MKTLKQFLTDLKVLDGRADAKVYLQNIDADVFLDFDIVKDADGNFCLTLYDVEQVSEWDD